MRWQIVTSQIVIPLSGGYDSRLIATLLVRRGYENILTFTYGVPGNKESAYSKKVADALGLKWHFVKYSNELWREAWITEERRGYQKWASGWNSIAYIQDWLAVGALKQNGTVDLNCVFVPGHTGDFISGGHIPNVAIKDKTSSAHELFESIKTKHYRQAPKKEVTSRTEQMWFDRIIQRTEQRAISNGQNLANAFEKWEWQERQAKLICNSVRVYEFYRYDWWMPLWDMEFVRFWQSVPLDLRKGSAWYIDYVKQEFSKEAVAINEMSNSSDTSCIYGLSKSIINYFLPKNVINLLKSIYKKRLSAKHPLGFWGAFDSVSVRELLGQGYTWHGVRAKAFLEDFEKNE